MAKHFVVDFCYFRDLWVKINIKQVEKNTDIIIVFLEKVYLIDLKIVLSEDYELNYFLCYLTDPNKSQMPSKITMSLWSVTHYIIS